MPSSVIDLCRPPTLLLRGRNSDFYRGGRERSLWGAFLAVELLPILAAHREEAGSFRKVEVCDEQPLLAIRMVAEQRSIGPDNCRRGRRTLACLVDRGEVAGVLGG